MSTPIVLDSSVLVAWVLQHAGRWQAVQRLLNLPDEKVLPAPGLAEVIYISRERGNASAPAHLRAVLEGVTRIEPVTGEDALMAAQLHEISVSAGHAVGDRARTLSLAGSFVLAVAVRLKARVVTMDGHWKWLQERGRLPDGSQVLLQR